MRLGLAGGARRGARARSPCSSADLNAGGLADTVRAYRRRPDATGPAEHRPRRRAHHPRAPKSTTAHRAHRRDEGKVDRRVRARPARLESGLVDWRVPVRQEREVEGRRRGRVPRARRGARADRRRRRGRAGTRWARAGRGSSAPAPRTTTPQDAREGWAQIKRDLAAEKYGLYVLDEFTYPMKWGWVDVDDVVDTLRARPGHQHVIITGRDADPRLIEAADLVDADDQDQAPDGRRPKGPAGHRMVNIPRVVIAAPGQRARQDQRRHRPAGRLRRARADRVAAQGRPRLHRPGLSRAGRRPARAQPRPVAGRRGAHRAAVPARRADPDAGRHRDRRRRHGAVRRSRSRRRCERQATSPRPPTSPRCCRRR